MNEITNPPVREALEKLAGLSADAEARRLAFVRERTLLREAREDGWEAGLKEGRAEALRAAALGLLSATKLDDATIAATLGLDLVEVTALRQEHVRAMGGQGQRPGA